MPSNARNAQLDQLANALAQEIATAKLRVANYFTPYNFDPEQEDLTRVSQLMDQHKGNFTHRVFGGATPTLMQRVDEAVTAVAQKQVSLDALESAGAQVTSTEAERFAQAVANSFGGSRMAQQAAANGVN